jgi:hypothetical protein
MCASHYDGSLLAETVEGSSVPLESVADVHHSDGLATSVLSVRDCVTQNVLAPDKEDTTGFLVDQARDTLDTTTASQTSNGGFLHG